MRRAAMCVVVLAMAAGCAKTGTDAPKGVSLAAPPAQAGNTTSTASEPSTADEEKPLEKAPPTTPSPVAVPSAVAAKDDGEGRFKAGTAAKPSTAGAGFAGGGVRGDAFAGATDSKAAGSHGGVLDNLGQTPGVRAGEWDDNANFRDFSKWLGTIHYAGARPMNLTNRHFLVVRDKDGKAVPGCSVEVRDSQAQRSTALVTMASGRALFFPHAEGLEGATFEATARCREGDAKTTFTRQAEDGIVQLNLQAARRDLPKRAIDIAFVLDTTGSMAEEIAAVKTTIQKVSKALMDGQTEVRVGLVEYKDRSDPYVTKTFQFSSNLEGFAAKVSQLSAGGGGDLPEDMNAGLRTALSDLRWNDNAVAKIAFVIADAPPHLDYPNDIDYAKSTLTAAHRGIKFYTVAASGMDLLGQVVFRQMAQYTGGTNMFVLRGGAGPQSTGGGDPGSSCGGTHTNYASGNLDELIVTKARRELKSVDQDPMRIAGLGEDESAKPCDRRIVYRD